MDLTGLFEALKNSNVFGVFIFQDRGEIVYANEQFLKMMEFNNPSECLGKSFFEYIVSKKDEIINSAQKRVLGEETKKEYRELLVKTKNGNIIVINAFVYTIDFNNKPSGIVLMIDKTNEIYYQKLYFALSQVNQLIVRSDNEENLLKELCDIMVDKIGYTTCFVGYIDKDSKLFIQKYTRAKIKEIEEISKDLKISIDPSTPYGCGTLSQAYHSQKITILENVSKQPMLAYWKNYYEKFNIHSACTIPLIQKREVKYLIYLNDKSTNAFSNEYLQLLEELQIDLSFALNRFEEQKFFQMTQLAIDTGFEFLIITDQDFNIIHANDKAISISEYSKEELIGTHHSIFSSKSYDKEFVKNFYSTLKSGLPFSNFMKYKTKSGKILDFYVNIIPFKQNGKITNYIAIGKLIDEKDAVERLQRILYEDPITNLPNYRSFQERLDHFLKRAIKENVIGAVAIINPISFHSVNQALGFKKANEVLRLIGERLKNSLYSYDVIAKLESDRFGIIIKDVKTEEDIVSIVSRILNRISSPYIISNQILFLHFNIGLSIVPKDGTTTSELLNKANIALQDAKEKGKQQIGFFRKEIEEKAIKKLQIKANLQTAVTSREFIPFYQPYVNKNNEIVGAEALMRWKKEDKILPPSEFIECLEESQLVVDAEYQLIDKIAQNIKDLEKFKRDLPISINLSGQSLKQSDLHNKLLSTLEYYKINPKLLKIEIVERAFFKDFLYIKKLIDDLNKINIHFCIDDFGTHYSSLRYLSELNVSFLKIDISFTRKIQTDPKTKNIVSSIIYLAHSLNIKTIAEGVETVEQFEILKDMNCDYFQGYLFYKPMQEDDFFKALKL